MEDKKKKGGRRAYLDDFAVNAAGEYIYTGATYRYSKENSRPLHSTLTVLWCFTLGLAVSSFISGFLPAAGSTGCVYVVLPLVVEVVAACTVAWAMLRLTVAGDPMRAYVYTGTVEKLPVRAMFCAIAAGVGLLAEGVYLLCNGFGGKVPATVGYLLLKAAAAVFAVFLFRESKKPRWAREEC